MQPFGASKFPFKSLALVLLAALFLGGGAYGYFGSNRQQVQRADEAKAEYLFDFLAMVDWPKTDALTVCFAGGPGVQKALTTAIDFKARTVEGHRVVARQVTDLEALEGCQLLYLDRRMTSMPAASSIAGMLAVSDAKGYVYDGGMIELTPDLKRLRFSINTVAIKQNGLTLKADFQARRKALETDSTRFDLGR